MTESRTDAYVRRPMTSSTCRDTEPISFCRDGLQRSELDLNLLLCSSVFLLFLLPRVASPSNKGQFTPFSIVFVPSTDTPETTGNLFSTMEDLDQSNHALAISEMSDIYLDPAELEKMRKSKADAGPTNSEEKVRDAHKILAAQPRVVVTKEHHEELVQSIFEDLARLRNNIHADFQCDELERYMSLIDQLCVAVLVLAKSDLMVEAADGKEEGQEVAVEDYGLKVD
jgi:hypothetical protein